MKIQLSQVKEKEQQERALEQRKGKWEYFQSRSLPEVMTQARLLGWAENKVQVKWIQIATDAYEYYVEPYEDCTCPNLIPYVAQ